MAGVPTTTTALTSSAIADRLPGPVKTAGFAAALIAIEAVLAVSIVDQRFSRFLMLFAAVGAAAFVFRFPAATALAMLGLTDFIFHPGFAELSLGPIDVALFELALGGLLVVAVVRPRRETWGGMAGAALAAFLLLVAISALAAITSGRAELTDVLNWGRPLGMLTFFYVVVRLFPTPGDRRVLLTGGAILAALTGVVALLVALGWSVGDTLKGPGTQIVREEEGVGGVQRVRLAGLSLGYALFWYAAVQVAAARGRARTGWVLLLAGIALDIVVSFNRNMWFGLFVGMLLIMAVGGQSLRTRLAVAVAVVVAGAGLTTILSGPEDSRLVEPVLKRGATILDPSKVTRESSYRDREYETRIAWETARARPLLGVGAGADFGLFIDYQVAPGSYVRGAQLFLHNQYIYLWLIGGVGGLIAFMLFLGIPVAKAVTRSPRDPAITACGVGIVLIMISAVVAIYFTVEDMTTVLALLAGAIVADSQTRAADGMDSGLSP